MIEAIYIGCIIAILRYLLDDKWKLLPEKLCRFCIGFWICVLANFGAAICSFVFAPEFFSITSGNIAVSVVVVAIGYTYLKTSN